MNDSASLNADTGDRHTEDHFNRKPFARRLANTIVRRQSTESFVIGLYGAWGEGKTTVLDYMDEVLTEFPDTILVRFNPWLFNSDEALVKALIDAIDSEIGSQLEDSEKKQELQGLLLSYGGKLAKVAGSVAGNGYLEKAGEFAESLADGHKSEPMSLEQLKDRISKALLQIDQRVVVLIDDIDRLTRHEIQQVFRLIKVAADFPTVTYVLAFDPDMVASAVAAQYGSGTPEDGQRFLEKIVQLPLHLPHVDRPSMTEYTLNLLDGALQEAGVQLTEGQRQRFSEVLSEDIMAAIQTPRQAKRYANAVTFALPILRGETEPVDVMLVEALRVLYPQTFKLIRSHPEAFLNPDNAFGVTQPNSEEIKNHLSELLKDHNPYALDLVYDLFPEVRRVMLGILVRRLGDVNRPQGVSQRRYFPRYFQYAIAGDDVYDAQITEFLADVVESPEKAQVLLANIAVGKQAAKFMWGLKDAVYSCNEEMQDAVLLALAREISGFANNPFRHSLVRQHYTVIELMVSLVEQRSPDKALALGKQLLDTLPLVYALYLMDGLENRERRRGVNRYYAEQEASILSQLEEYLVQRLEQCGSRLRDTLGDKYFRGLRRIVHIRGRPATEALLVQELNAGQSAVEEFLLSRSPRSFFSETGESRFLPREFGQESYSYLKALIDPATLLPYLDQYYPERPQPEERDALSEWMDGSDEVTADPHEAAYRMSERIRELHRAKQAKSDSE
ncbi:KAP family P-loop NTPase fold protein [Deinococcus sp. SL84]|uniref:KAP family P-loop NTPase fold protein n=1 Tax=Deinococcus sp. SL84 TaxID=2994663 RepID=UPI002273D9AA|nr:KAP family NTPase [Deinococcus sp. SL84]MCY1704300.1 KAP family NTPase [Deinococcus sp. SL84]